MNIYRHNEDIFISYHKYDFKESNIDELKNAQHVYLLKKSDPFYSKFRHKINSASQLNDEENIEYIIKNSYGETYINNLIAEGKLSAINTNFIDFINTYKSSPLKKKYKINIAGLGDVGGTLAIGLRLMGGDIISEIGIFDLDENKIKRWQYELNQIYYETETPLPNVVPVSIEDVFNCDVFVFCITKAVPDVSIQNQDVRIVQYNGNAEIIKIYADLAKKANYNGLFFVVSDPVDHLCKKAFYELNKEYIFPSDNIKGFGLGVMYARAKYYAEELGIEYFKNHGRVFGPHGKDLVVADNIKDYNDEMSIKLTELTTTANLEVRKTGFKPYIAPALSSGALSILSCLKGDWHYSTVKLGDAFLGIKNRLTEYGVEMEVYENLDNKLFNRIKSSYERLVEFNVWNHFDCLFK